MMRENKQKWICSDPKCRHEVLTIHSSREESLECGCGAKMKRVYTAPQLRSIESETDLHDCRDLFLLVRHP